MKKKNQEALGIIRKHQSTAPVDLIRMADELGLAVYLDDTLPKEISGVLNQDGKGYLVLVNATHHLNRQRFTLAHEIAHFVLHRDRIGSGIEDSALYRSHLSDRHEREANSLAADILMPWHLINGITGGNGDASVATLAKKLRVSKSAMAIRLGVPLEEG